MNLKVEDRDGVGIVRISDDITQELIGEFSEFFRDQVNPKFTSVILDLVEVDYFCSSAMSVAPFIRGSTASMISPPTFSK